MAFRRESEGGRIPYRQADNLRDFEVVIPFRVIRTPRPDVLQPATGLTKTLFQLHGEILAEHDLRLPRPTRHMRRGNIQDIRPIRTGPNHG